MKKKRQRKVTQRQATKAAVMLVQYIDERNMWSLGVHQAVAMFLEMVALPVPKRTVKKVYAHDEQVELDESDLYD